MGIQEISRESITKILHINHFHKVTLISHGNI